MKVLVTGANSLLGTNILLELLDRGAQVKAMVRDRRKLLISHQNLAVCIGDVTNKDSVLEAVEGCDIVIHVAADTSQSSLNYNKYKRVNVDGTIGVLKAANDYGVKRVILVSSANAFAFGTKDNPGTEKEKISFPFSRACYARSKYEAQKVALALARELQTELVVVNPTFMLGAYDSKPSSGEIILRGYKKKFIIAPPGGKNFIHVKDAAYAVCQAIEKGRPGECYLLANENMSYKAFYEKLIQVTGQKSRIISIPKSVLLFIGRIGTGLVKMGIPVSAHYVNMQILCVKNYYSNAKAKAELDLPCHNITLAIRDAEEWFLDKKMIS